MFGGESSGDPEQIAGEALATLGSMKGLALKVGQMLSYMDGVVPEHRRAAFHKVLAPLLQAAPAMPWSSIEPVLVAELGAPVSELFAQFEPQPFAAASIGQVHRAVLPSGLRVAVKVQYPGIEQAMHADLKNLSLLKSLAAPFLGLAGRGSMATEMSEIIGELRKRLLEEIDYRHEAAMQERFRSLLAGDPDVHVPRVIAERSSRRVLTSEYVDGRSYDHICEHATQRERDRLGAVLSRTIFRCIFRFRLFNGDPHPGNYLFHDDGRVTLLDFGCVKELPEPAAAAMIRYTRAAAQATRSDSAADWHSYDRAIADAFKLDVAEPGFEIYRQFTLYCLRPYIVDEPFTFTPEYTGGSVDALIDGLRRQWAMPQIPADFTFIGRLQWGFYSVLTRMRATANWHRTLPEELWLA